MPALQRAGGMTDICDICDKQITIGQPRDGLRTLKNLSPRHWECAPDVEERRQQARDAQELMCDIAQNIRERRDNATALAKEFARTGEIVGDHEVRRIPGYETTRHAAIGRRTIYVVCSFCFRHVEGYVWSLAGSGKRCECGALLTSNTATKLTTTETNDD
jgi:hypothetical protein